MDLKKYMDKVEKVGDGEGLGPDIVKVRVHLALHLLARPWLLIYRLSHGCDLIL